MIGEGQDLARHLLPGLMPLAGDEQDIAAPQQRQAVADRLRAIADLDGRGRCRQDGRPDLAGCFAARIVVGDDRDIRKTLNDGPHLRTFAAIAVAARTEGDDQSAVREGPQCRQRHLESGGGMRIVHEDRRSIGPARHQFEPPRGTLEIGHRVKSVVERDVAAGRRQGRGDPGVGHLEGAEQRHLDPARSLSRIDRDDLVEAVAGDVQDAQRLALAADRPKVEPRDARGRDEGGMKGIVDVDHRHRSRIEDRIEETGLGRQIGLHRAVIVEMVAREIGEGGRPNGETVEPALIEPVG